MKLCAARFHGEKEEQRNEHAVTFAKKRRKGCAAPHGRPPGGGAPAEICEAKFRGAKEPQRNERAMSFL